MQSITLKLWVSNQAGVDSDMTYAYIQGSRWAAPDGVVLDVEEQTLSGPAAKTWQAYRSLAASVAAVGHGLDDASAEEAAGEPCLTACPTEIVHPDYTCAAESLARTVSSSARTWAEFVRQIPELAR
jgi:hypothetical protein